MKLEPHPIAPAFLAAFFLAFAPTGGGQVLAQGEVPAHRLSEFRFGETVSGDAVALEALGSKVTVIEYWGTR